MIYNVATYTRLAFFSPVSEGSMQYLDGEWERSGIDTVYAVDFARGEIVI